MSGKEKTEITSKLFKHVLPDECNEAEKEAKTIPAEEVVEAVKSGKAVEIINAVIEGSLIFKSLIIEGEITIQRTKVVGHVDCSYATFKQVLNLESSIFESDVIFTAATLEKDIFLNGATFHGKAAFSDLTVMGVFYSRSTTFKKEAVFSGAGFKKRLISERAILKGKPTLQALRSGVMPNSPKPCLRTELASTAPRSRGLPSSTPRPLKGWPTF